MSAPAGHLARAVPSHVTPDTAQQLLARYAWAIDGRDWAALRDVFSEDAVADYEAFTCVGHDEIVARMQELHEDLDASQHLVGSILVDAEGCRVRSQVQATLVKRGGAGRSVLTVTARYDDTVRATTAGLRIARRTVRGVTVHGNRDILPWLGGRTRHGNGA